jgi:hypothetical protein
MAVGIRLCTCPLVVALAGCGEGTIDLFAEQRGRPSVEDATRQQEAATDTWIPTLDWDAADADSDEYVEAGTEAEGSSPQDAVAEVGEAEAGATVEASTTTEGCLSNADCASLESPRCEPTQHVCVQCIGAPGDCANQRESVCNRITNRCELPCTSNDGCMSPDVCDLTQGACADCLQNSQCPAGAPYCVSEECVECMTISDCKNGQVCWHQRCVACVTNADCHEGGTCSTYHECI